MSKLTKLPYEISLWEDRLTVVYEDGSEDDGLAGLSTEKPVVGQYYKEHKLCVIGSNTMDTDLGIVEPVLNRKTDGTSTLTFSIYAKYYDGETGEFLENPFLQYLTNERKVKLKYYPNGELRWLDFIIKKIDETSENYKFKYTASDLFINELSKTGYSLEFDTELENGQGTVEKLANDILSGTDWEVGEDSELIQQTVTESLYEVELSEDLQAFDIFTNTSTFIKKGEKIYIFYSVIANQTLDYYQFIYDVDGKYPQDENNVVHGIGNYYCNFQTAPNWELKYFNKFRGERYVRSQKSTYDPVLERYVKVYQSEDGKEIYGYEESEYYGPSLVQTFVTNGETILSDSGWRQENKRELKVNMTPGATDFDLEKKRRFYLEYEQREDNKYLLNTGLRDNAKVIGEISKDDKFVFGVTLGKSLSNNVQLRLQLIKYVLNKEERLDENDANDAKDEILYTGYINTTQEKDFVYYLKDISLFDGRAITKQELIEVDPIYRFGIFISFVDANGQIINDYKAQIYNMTLFRQYNGRADGKEGIILPDGTVLYETDGVFNKTKDIAESYVNTKYYYYPVHTNNDNITKPEQIQYLHIGDKLEGYKEIYNSNFEKIRSISKKETNRFDLLQTLSETFECWCRFDIWHKDTGEIMLAKDVITLIDGGNATSEEKIVFLGGDAYSLEEIIVYCGEDLSNTGLENPFQQMKFVTFHSRIGQKKNIGFRYGINLKSVSRTLDSNAIATKLIVKSNTNEFAEGGSCNIALAKENPSGENFVYDFTYYINQGLINEENLGNDLYYYDINEERGWIGLYARLKPLNRERDDLITQQTALLQQYNHSKSDYEYGRVRLSAIEDELYDLNAKYEKYKTNSDYDKNNEKLLALIYDICRLNTEQQEIQTIYDKAKKDKKMLEENIQKIDTELQEIENKTATLIRTFEQKYVRFIQEASWTSEDYTDHNLYYIDAETTLHKSAQPKVSYNINIIELNQIEGYENYNFDLGDISYVIDTDFFGWIEKDGIKTPRREEIVITETSTNFHSPDKCSIKAQNYRSTFEDLFRRLTATTQQLQFHNGEFQRAADVVDANGNIAPSSLADAFANNAYLLSNVANQTVKWNEFGITTSDAKNPAEITRITSGGIFLTSDGGEKWTTGITAKGINAKMITTGVLDTGKVNIYNGSQKAFVWDASGLNAYKTDEGGKYSFKNFVRFDQYGIYGINKTAEFLPTSIDDIKENATFLLADDGLFLRDGVIEINDKTNGITIDPLNKKGETDEAYKVFSVKSNNNEVLWIDNKGNAKFEGEVTIADGANIGGWLIKSNNDNKYLGSEDDNYFLSTSGIDSFNFVANKNTKNVLYINNVFCVDVDGNLYSSQGIIGSWKIGEDGIYSGKDFGSSTIGMSPSNPDFTFWSGGATEETAKFRVNSRGKLFAQEADITGNITADSLTIKDSAKVYGTLNASNIQNGSFGANNNITIGGWNINNNAIYKGNIKISASNEEDHPELGRNDPLVFQSGIITGKRTKYAYYTKKYTYPRTDDVIYWQDDLELSDILNLSDINILSASGTVPSNSYLKQNGKISYSPIVQFDGVRFTFQETAYPADDTVGHGGDSYPFYITVYYSYSEQYGTIPTFGVTQSGAIYASSGLIGGWKLGDTMLAGKDDGTEISLSPGGIFIKSSKYQNYVDSISWVELFNLLRRI